jgi:hypothetical protein
MVVHKQVVSLAMIVQVDLVVVVVDHLFRVVVVADILVAVDHMITAPLLTQAAVADLG